MVAAFGVVRVRAGVPVAAPVGSGAGVPAAGSGLAGRGRSVDPAIDPAEAVETEGTVATTITTGRVLVADELDGVVDGDVRATDGVELVAPEEPVADEPVTELPVDPGLESLVTELPVPDPVVTLEPDVTDGPEVTDESDESECVDESDDAADDPDDSLEPAELGSLVAAVDSSEPTALDSGWLASSAWTGELGANAASTVKTRAQTTPATNTERDAARVRSRHAPTMGSEYRATTRNGTAANSERYSATRTTRKARERG